VQECCGLLTGLGQQARQFCERKTPYFWVCCWLQLDCGVFESLFPATELEPPKSAASQNVQMSVEVVDRRSAVTLRQETYDQIHAIDLPSHCTTVLFSAGFRGHLGGVRSSVAECLGGSRLDLGTAWRRSQPLWHKAEAGLHLLRFS